MAKSKKLPPEYIAKKKKAIEKKLGKPKPIKESKDLKRLSEGSKVIGKNKKFSKAVNYLRNLLK